MRMLTPKRRYVVSYTSKFPLPIVTSSCHLDGHHLCRIADLNAKVLQVRTFALCISLRRPTGESNEPTSTLFLICHVITHVKDGN
jgi:hypothetical protein